MKPTTRSSPASRAPAGASTSRPRRGPGRPADSDSADTKARILQVALEQFAEHGYSGASTRAIAGNAGVTIATVYHHFGSKRALYADACNYGIEHAFLAYGRAVEGRGSVLDELAAMFETSLQIMRHEPAISRLALNGRTDPEQPVDPNDPPPVAREVLDAIIERAIARGELARADADTFSVLLGALHWGLTVVGLDDDDASRRCVHAYRRLLEQSLLKLPSQPAPPASS